MSRTLALAAASLVLALLTAGCATSPLAKRTSAFATAAAITSKDTANAYVLVEQKHKDAEVQAMVASFDTEGFHPEKIQPFMASKDMEARSRILNGLSKYAETLAYVSGDEPLNEFDKDSSALGKSLQDLSKSETMESFTKSAHISDTDINIATTAIDALGRALIEHRRSRDLPAILKEMKDPITQVCGLLQADIGDPEKSGLRNQLKNDYETLRQKQIKFIRDNKATMTPTEKRAAIEDLLTLVSDQAKGDRTLAATQDALKQMAATHSALAESTSAKDAPAFHTMLSELISDGQQLHGFYAQLPAQ